MPDTAPDLRVYVDQDELSQAAADLFVQRAQAAVADHGRFTVALSGGSTPHPTYERLATPAYRDAVPWRDMHVFWGDERCVPADHPDSNYRMAREALLSEVPVPDENVHRMAGEQPPQTAAKAYAQALRDVFGLSAGEQPRFDLILLGMGGDGHTASLFPGTDVLHEDAKLVAAYYVEKHAAYRLTLTPPVINSAAHVVFVVAGARKADILHQVLEGPHRPETLPAQLVRPTDGRLTWLVDEAAAGALDRKGTEEV